MSTHAIAKKLHVPSPTIDPTRRTAGSPHAYGPVIGEDKDACGTCDITGCPIHREAMGGGLVQLRERPAMMRRAISHGLSWRRHLDAHTIRGFLERSHRAILIGWLLLRWREIRSNARDANLVPRIVVSQADR